MGVNYFKCNGCGFMFLSGTNLPDNTLICGEGCGGELIWLTEEEALKEVDNYVKSRQQQDYC